MTKIKFYCEFPNDKTTYVFDFISKIMGVPFISTHIESEANIIYKLNPDYVSSSNSILIPVSESQPDFYNILRVTESHNYNSISFDILNFIWMLLSDSVNPYDPINNDNHDRLIFFNSYQHKNNIGETPIVNTLVNLLISKIKNVLGVSSKPLYPFGKKACIILTHDVDNPEKHDDYINYSLSKSTSPRKIYHSIQDYLTLRRRYKKDANPNDFWTFKEIFEAEKHYRFSSTSFFATRNNHSTNGHPLDVRYNVFKRKFKQLFKYMRANKCDIGLHAAYNTHQKAQYFYEEKKWLEKVSRIKVQGLRHHFWHITDKDKYDTLKKHELNGFNYDCSLAFNDHIGYRHNCALPFYPVNPKTNDIIQTLQLPTFIMDGNLFYDKSMSVEKAMTHIHDAITILLENKGVGAIDWHIRTSYPSNKEYKIWGETYIELLKYLSLNNNIWVTDCRQFMQWWQIDRLQRD